MTRIGVRDPILDPAHEEKGKDRLNGIVLDTNPLPGCSRLGKGVVGRGVLAEDLGGFREGKVDRRLTVGCRSSAAVVMIWSRVSSLDSITGVKPPTTEKEFKQFVVLVLV